MRVPVPPHDRPLLAVEEVEQVILADIRRLPPANVPLREAWGCVLAAEVPATGDLPPFTSSAMDGFAVRAEDVARATPGRPVSLRVVGEVTMGHPPEVQIRPAEAARVPTGGTIPQGADAVVPVEDCFAGAGIVRVVRPVSHGRHVRPAGEDVRAGDVLVPAGRRLLGPDVGLLAAAGYAVVPVVPRVRVGLLSTGNELVRPGNPLADGQIYDANAYTLDGAVQDAGAVAVDGGIVSDDPEAVVAALDELSGVVDVFVSSGGVAMGEGDPVKRAFGGGGEIAFFEVAMQPGKPQAFGSWAGKPFFGLPGNPVSAFVVFEVLVRPALLTMMGRPPYRPKRSAVLEGDIEGLPNKSRFARVVIRREAGRLLATPTGSYQSNLLGNLSRADGFALVPAGVEILRAGNPVEILLFRDDDEEER